MQLGLPFGDPVLPVVPAPHGPAQVSRGIILEAGRATWAIGLEPFYVVRHRRARRYLLRVEPDGRLRVTIPSRGSRREALAFASAQREWVARQRRQLAGLSSTVLDVPGLRERAARELPARLLQMAAQLDLQVSRVSVRNQRTRWGSCGRDGHICLNWRLVLMPDWVRDYVLVHELMHLRRADHSPAYWALVARAYPEYRLARRWLRIHGPGLR